MHNNFLVERSGKMSKSSGEFLTLQTLVDRGYHPLAYRMMCLQAHYRSELEFSWEGLGAALTRLKRMVQRSEHLKSRHAELVSASTDRTTPWGDAEQWTLKQVQGDEGLMKALIADLDNFAEAVANDLSTPEALTDVERVLTSKKPSPGTSLERESGRSIQCLGWICST